ncbi:Surface carbohydrate biosynthesis protein, LIC13510 family [Candidatus Nanopelagicaceae bacterium]
MSNSVLIWDHKERPPSSSQTVFLLREHESIESPRLIPILGLLEEKREHYKDKYLELIFNISANKSNYGNLVSKLKIRHNLSYWWLSGLSEKNNYSQSPHINIAISLLVVNDLLREIKPRTIKYSTWNENLADSIENLGKLLNINTERIHPGSSIQIQNKFSSLIRGKIPAQFKAVVWLSKYLNSRKALIGIGTEAFKAFDSDTTIVSYFSNFNPKGMEISELESNYWGPLPKMLNENGLKVSWLHIYIPNTSIPNAETASRYVERLNNNAKTNQIHTTLDGFLNARSLAITIRDFIRISRQIRKIRNTVRNNLGIYSFLFPLYKSEISNTFAGPKLIENLLVMNLIESAVNFRNPNQKCIYLYENQPWELSLIHAWKTKGLGPIIGVQHSTVLDWDLRYFHDRKTYASISKLRFPLPDKIAVNGSHWGNKLKQSGIPSNLIIETEALRYMYLANVSKIDRVSNGNFNCLVLGDYMKEKTINQLAILGDAQKYLLGELYVSIKSHPNTPIESSDFPKMDFKNTDSLLVDLLKNFDIVIASPVTSAAVDAYCWGSHVITIRESSSLNFSPLLGLPGAIYASTGEELAAILNEMGGDPPQRMHLNEIFNLDEKLSNWSALLGI